MVDIALQLVIIHSSGITPTMRGLLYLSSAQHRPTRGINRLISIQPYKEWQEPERPTAI